MLGGKRGIEPIGVARRNGYLNLHQVVGQSLLKLLPCFAAISGLEQSSMRALILIAVFPWAESRLPRSRVDYIWMRRIEFHVRAAGVFIFVKDLLPALSAVGRAEDSTLFVRSIRMAEHRGEKPVGVARIHCKRRNLLTVTKAQMLPRLARIARAIDSVADREIGTMQPFATRYVDDVAVRGSHGNSADRLRRLAVEDGIPGASIIGGLPNSAVHLADVEDVRLPGNTRRCARAATAERAHKSPMQIRAPTCRRRLTGSRSLRKSNGGERQAEEQTECEPVCTTITKGGKMHGSMTPGDERSRRDIVKG